MTKNTKTTKLSPVLLRFCRLLRAGHDQTTAWERCGHSRDKGHASKAAHRPDVLAWLAAHPVPVAPPEPVPVAVPVPAVAAGGARAAPVDDRFFDLLAECRAAVKAAKPGTAAHRTALRLLMSAERFHSSPVQNERGVDHRSVARSGDRQKAPGGRGADREQVEALESLAAAADDDFFAELHAAERIRSTDEEVRASCREMGCYTDEEIEAEVERERTRVLRPPVPRPATEAEIRASCARIPGFDNEKTVQYFIAKELGKPPTAARMRSDDQADETRSRVVHAMRESIK